MKHNPAFLTPVELARQFVLRSTELETLLRVVRNNDNASNQHVLVTAPRGRGKTMLVHRTALAMQQDPALSHMWLPILFGEESYSVSTPGELWLEALLHAADASGDSEVRQAWETLRTERDERILAVSALARLTDLSDRLGRRLMLVIENLDSLLDDQFHSDDEWALRKVLQTEPRLMLLGTSVHRFEGEQNEERALFEGFRRIDLLPLTDSECAVLWAAVSEHEIPFERAAAIRILTGGSPRLVVLMAEFAEGRSLRTLLTELTALIDQNTDYFKHNIESMAPQLRRVFVALATLWTPATTREVAAEARLDVNVTSALLKRLTDQGRVDVVDPARRNRTFQVAERLYNIYHLLRRRNGTEPRVRAVVDFIHTFYEPMDMPGVVGRVAREALTLSNHERSEHLQLIHQLVATSFAGPDMQASLLSRVPLALRQSPEYSPELTQVASEPQVLYELLAGPSREGWIPDGKRAMRRAARTLAADERWPTLAEVGLAKSLFSQGVTWELMTQCGLAVLKDHRPPTDTQRDIAILASAFGLSLAGWPTSKFVDLSPDEPGVLVAASLQRLTVGAPRPGDDDMVRTADPSTFAWTAEIAEHVVDSVTSRGVYTLPTSFLERLAQTWPTADHLVLAIISHGIQRHPHRADQVFAPVQCTVSGRGWRAFADAESQSNLLEIVHDPAPSARSLSFVARLHLGMGERDAALATTQRILALHPYDDGAFIHAADLIRVLNPEGLLDTVDGAQHVEMSALRAVALLDRLAHGVPYLMLRQTIERISSKVPTEWAVDIPIAAMHARLAEPDLALIRVRRAFVGSNQLRDDDVLSLLHRLAAQGHGMKILNVLSDTTARSKFEPLFAALHDLAGRTPPLRVPQEVRDISEHVKNRIAHLAQVDDVWAVDPMSMPITPLSSAS